MQKAFGWAGCVLILVAGIMAEGRPAPRTVWKTLGLEQNAPSATPSPTPAPTPWPRTYTEQFQDSEVNACIESVCGPAKTNWGAYDVMKVRIENPSLEARSIWDRKFQARVLQLMRAQKASRLHVARETQRALDLEKDFAATNANPLLGAFRSIAKIAPHFQKIISESLFEYDTRSASFVLKAEPMRALLKNVTEAELESARLMGGYVLMQYMYGRMDSTFGNVLASRLERLQKDFPFMDRRQIQVSYAYRIQDQINLARRNLGEEIVNEMLTPLQELALANAMTAQDLNPLESDTLADLATAFEMLTFIYDPARRDLFASVFDIQKELVNLRKSRLVAKGYLKARQDSPEQAAQKIDEACRSRVTFGWDLSTSSLRMRQARQAIEEIRSAAGEVILRHLNDKDKPFVMAALQQIQFAFPATSQDSLRVIDDVIAKEMIEAGQDLLKKSAKTKLGRQILIWRALMAAIQESPDGLKSLNEVSSVAKVCESKLPKSSLSDFAMTSLGKISTSWMSINDLEVGVPVMAHEVGHALAEVVRKVKEPNLFLSSRQCISNRNPFLMEPAGLTATEPTWTEEDWADHFSTQVMDVMAKRGSRWASSKNMGCALIVDSGDAYVGNTMEPASGDTHSSGFLRLLFIAQDKNEITPACAPFLRAISSHGRPLTCE